MCSQLRVCFFRMTDRALFLVLFSVRHGGTLTSSIVILTLFQSNCHRSLLLMTIFHRPKYIFPRMTLSIMTPPCLTVMENLEVSQRNFSLSWPDSAELTNMSQGDLFDETDFVVSTTGNPDEVTLDPDSLQKKQTPESTHGHQMNHARPHEPPNLPPITPARPNMSVPPSRPQSNILQNPNPNPIPQGGPTVHKQGVAGAQPAPPVQSRPNPQTAQAPVKREASASSVPDDPNIPIPAAPTSVQRQQEQQLPAGGTPATFFSARAFNPHNAAPAVMAPQLFDPHAESPSIRKTAGFDHSKSIPIKRPMLASVASPSTAAAATTAANNNGQARDFVNPSMDMCRKIGAPGGGLSSPIVNQGQISTSSYRLLTRPNVGAPKGAGDGAKRPPLGDMANANATTARNWSDHDGDPKRQRVDAHGHGIASGDAHIRRQ